MFALAANGFNKPSETFIRAHARLIAPGRTLLIAERRDFETPIDAPLIMFSKRFPIAVHKGSRIASVISGILSPTRYVKSREAYLASLLQMHGVQVLMSEYGSTAIHLADAARIAGCRLFVHFHGVDASTALRDSKVVQSYQQLFKQAEGIIAPSVFLAKKLCDVGCPVDKLHVVPCGVDTDAFVPAIPKPYRLLSVGRFTEKKSPISTIAAFDLVKKIYPEAFLEMMGDGPLLTHARAEVSRLRLGESVFFSGMATPTEVIEAMRKSSVFVQHSVTAKNGDVEGLPVAILEAMAAGMPVVSTHHSGIPEAVADGQTGYLVPEFDIEGMAASINNLFADSDLARSYGRAGRQRVIDEFSQTVTIKKLQKIMGLQAFDQHQGAVV